MKRRIHFRFMQRPLCGIRAGGQHYSRQITTTGNERDVTCMNCQRLLRTEFQYDGFALFDEQGALFWDSVQGSRSAVRRWVKESWLSLPWPQARELGYRIERVMIQRVAI